MVDVDGGRAFFARTDPQLLRAASFLDGRVPFATSEPAPTELAPLLLNKVERNDPDRLIFNCSFCGSTYLARLVDVPGSSLVLKEPRALVDLAAWTSLNIADGLPIDRLDDALTFALAAIRRRFATGEVVTIKVGNQANVLIHSIAKTPRHVRPVFNTIGRLDFLRAIFRGGAGRMRHAAQIAWHMAKVISGGEDLLAEAQGSSIDPLQQAANLALVDLHLQLTIFREAASKGGWDERHFVDYSDIIAAPRDAAQKTTAALDLPIDMGDIERNLDQLASRNAKIPSEAFSAIRQDAIHNQLHAEYGKFFDQALDWADKTLGSEFVS